MSGKCVTGGNSAALARSRYVYLLLEVVDGASCLTDMHAGYTVHSGRDSRMGE